VNKSAHLTTAERCTQTINMWLVAINSMFDHVTADRNMLTTAEHCITATGLAVCGFLSGLHLTMDGCTRMLIAHS